METKDVCRVVCGKRHCSAASEPASSGGQSAKLDLLEDFTRSTSESVLKRAAEEISGLKSGFISTPISQPDCSDEMF